MVARIALRKQVLRASFGPPVLVSGVFLALRSVIMASQGVNVLRYSALVAGLIYGVYHQSSLNTKSKSAEIDREYKRKASLIEQAKAEWKKKTMPAEKKTESGGLITDPEDSRFDLEAFLTNKAAETAK